MVDAEDEAKVAEAILQTAQTEISMCLQVLSVYFFL